MPQNNQYNKREVLSLGKNLNNNPERAILVGLSARCLSDEENSTEETLDELSELVKTAGGVEIGRILQSKSTPNPGMFIGEGKAQEIKDFIKNNDVNLVVFDNNLSPSQNRSLEKFLECHVIDRSGLILDIFAARARTSEGKLQVELAQYEYLLPRLSGMWKHLESQTASGGKAPIGTRGPGETQLETDRRHIREKITKLKSELEAVKKNRATQRQKRAKSEIPLVAIVGYTNAGKSTLLNTITGANIQANNRLFDTLDPTTRTCRLCNGQNILLSDTVGFIRKLPHFLINAFKATLEELTYADLILHVIDASNPQYSEHEKVTSALITELCGDKVDVIRVFNKIDLCSKDKLDFSKDTVCISAATGTGIDMLLSKIEQKLLSGRHEVTFSIPYDKSSVLDNLYNEARVIAVNYMDSHISVNVMCNSDTLKKYIGYTGVIDE